MDGDDDDDDDGGDEIVDKDLFPFFWVTNILIDTCNHTESNEPPRSRAEQCRAKAKKKEKKIIVLNE